MALSIGDIDLGLNINQKHFNSQLRGLSSGAQNSVKSAFAPLGKMIGAALGGAAVVSFTKSCVSLGSELSEVQNVVDTVFPSMSAQVNKFAQNAMEQFGLSEAVAKKYMGTLGAMSSSMGFTEKQSYDMAEAVTGLAGDVASFYNMNSDEAFTKLKSIWTGETETLKELGVLMTQANLDQYALANGYGVTTKNMDEQTKAMLRYQYVTSALSKASGDFAKTQDGWANSTRVLKLRFDSLKATLGQGFINLFTPILQIINALLGRLSVLANGFSKFTELITGKKQSTASQNLNDIASGADNAASSIEGTGDAAESAAKKAEKSLAGFDKITKLGDSASSGSKKSGAGASSGGASALDLSAPKVDIFGKTDVNQQMQDFVQKLKDAFKSGNFAPIGAIVGDKINKALANINWSKIKSTTKKIVKSIATLLNGFVKKTDWKLVGKTIAEGLNTAVIATDTWLTTVDWEAVATAVGDSINGCLKTFDWKKLGETIAHWINAATKYVLTLIKTIDFGALAKAVGKLITGFFEEIKLGDLAKVVGLAIAGKLVVKNILKHIITPLSGLKSSIGTKLGEAISGSATLGKIKVAAGTLLKGLSGCVTAAVGGFKLGQKIYELVTGEDTSQYDYSTLFNSTGENWKDALSMMWSDLGTWFKENCAFSTIFTSTREDWAGAFKLMGEDFKRPFVNIGKWFKGKFTDAKNAIKTAFSDVGEFFSGVWTKISGTFTNVGKWFKEKFSDAWDAIKNVFSNVGEFFSGIWTTIKGVFVKLGTNIGDAVGGAFKTALNGALTIIEGVLNTPIKAINGMLGLINKVLPKNIPKLKEFKLPRLAEGGYVAANTPQLAMIGDNRHQGEVVAPEDKLEQMALKAASLSEGSMTSEVVALLKTIIAILNTFDFDIIMDGESVKNKVVKRINNATKRNGRCELKLT